MFHWLHHLFNPHCEWCEQQKLDSKVCNACEILKMELASVKQERDRLLNRLLTGPETVAVEKEPETDFKPLFTPKHIPWAVRRQTLEAEDRRAAKLKKEKEEEIAANVIKTRPVDIEKPLTVAEMEEAIVGEEDAVSGSDAQVQAR